MGSSFCDPTRQVCPFGAPIDPTLSLINNVYVRSASEPVVSPGIAGPYKPEEPIVSSRQAPFIFTGGGGGNGFTLPSLPPISIPISFGREPGPVPQIPGRTPPLLPGRIPPAPLAFPQSGGGCGGCAKCVPGGAVVNGCCPKGCHPDKKWGVKCVRNRRMNALNPRALRRALRRVDQFESFVNKTAKLTGLRLAKKSTRRK